MAIQKTEALVLKASKFRDTSLITTFFTSDFGKIKAIAKGVRKERSSLMPHYEPFSHVQIIFYEKTKSDIQFLSESSLIYFFAKIRASFEKISWASYLMEIVDIVLPPHDKSPGFFRLLLNVLNAMEEKRSPSHLVSIFEVKLLLESGLLPNFEGCMQCGRKDTEGYLSLPEGRIFCDVCRNPSGDFFLLPRDLIKAIGFFAASDFTRCLHLEIGSEMEEELHRMVYRWVRYRFERDVVTFRFLREVGILPSSTSLPESSVK